MPKTSHKREEKDQKSPKPAPQGSLMDQAKEVYHNKKLNLQLESESKKASIYKFAVVLDYIAYNHTLPGIKNEPRVKMTHLVNFQKGTSLIFFSTLCLYLEAFEPIHIVYVALHGGYGIIWILKFLVFRDKSFDRMIPLTTAFNVALILFFYWMIGVMCLTKKFENNRFTTERIFWAILANLVGTVIMIGSDVQKGTQLEFKKGLISTGFFSRTRNPNYLGEMLLYGAFAILSADWRSWGILGFVWCTLFLQNMALKELSFMQKKGWIEYREQTLMILPRLVRGDGGLNWALNYVIYGGLAVAGKVVYDCGGVIGVFEMLARA